MSEQTLPASSSVRCVDPTNALVASSEQEHRAVGELLAAREQGLGPGAAQEVADDPLDAWDA